MNDRTSITDIPGIRVGHAQDDTALTGCTVVLCEGGAVAGIDQRGGAPGTRETDLLRPMHLVEKIHAVALCGGSAFGLDAASGVMRYLEERGIGFNTGIVPVPIVPAAVIFDLAIGRADIRPDSEMGYQACLNASQSTPAEGNVGAGTGATVGKALGISNAMKAGIGTASIEISPGLVVGAITAVNAFGDVVEDGRIIAGVRQPGQQGFADTLQVMKYWSSTSPMDKHSSSTPNNTVIGVVATNASLTKEQVNKVAQMAHDGLARAIRPAHTQWDGDTIFALATGNRVGDEPTTANINLSTIGAFAAETMTRAIIRAVRAARPIAGLPTATSLDEASG